MNDGHTILISGAGPVGLAVAALLSASRHAGRSTIHVVDPADPPHWNAQQTDLRVYALSRASQRIFEQLGLWSAIAGGRACAYERMHVWQGPHPDGAASLRFDSADIGEPDLGHIVEDALLKSVLAESLAGVPGVTMSYGTAIDALEHGAQGIVATLRNGDVIEADLLIAADGGRSAVRSMLGLATIGRSYGQQAVVAHVATERPHGNTAWQRFLPGGPLAFLPLSDGRSSIVWSLPEARARRLVAAPEAEFLAALQDASADVLGRLGPLSARTAFPLQILHAVRYCCRRGVLIGDAAHVVHPLAGQGMNLGLADALSLAAEIDAAIASGRHPGDFRVLRRYERSRKGENMKMMLALDALHHLFRLPSWAGPLRSLGLGAVHAAPAAKRALMREALGLERDRVRGPGARAVA